MLNQCIGPPRNQSLVLPAPTGPYAVGRREYYWTDQSRYDTLAPHAGMKRELVVWAWYPALPEPGAVIASYLPSTWAQLSDEQHGFIGQQLLQSNSSSRATTPFRPIAWIAWIALHFSPWWSAIPCSSSSRGWALSRRNTPRCSRILPATGTSSLPSLPRIALTSWSFPMDGLPLQHPLALSARRNTW